MAQLYAPQSLERYFRLEWQVTHGRKGPAIEGYVYNQAMRGAERIRLQIERLDDAGKVVGSSTVWVLGGVQMDSRAYFRASVPDAARYRCRCSHSTGLAVAAPAAACSATTPPATTSTLLVR